MTPEVSVIVPMWNSAATIEATLNSLCAQSLQDWEAIVIDDGSTDAGPSIAGRIADTDSRVRVISQSNRGLSVARNAGLQHARGRFIQFLDADDSLPPHSIANLWKHATSNGGAAFGAFAWVSPDPGAETFEVEISCRSAGLDELLERNRFPVHAQMLDRSLLGDERFDESLRSAEDWELWLRLAARGVRWSGLDEVVAYYHLTPGSMSRDETRMLDAMTLVLRSAFAAARAEARPDCNASRERERAVRVRLALECASGATLQDDSTRAVAAAELLKSTHPARAEIKGRALAVAAYWALPQAARVTPASWRRCDPRWLVGLDRFWRRCEVEGWSGEGSGKEARAWLSELLVEPSEIASEIVRRAGAARSIELLGLGRNGRRIARALCEHAIPFAVRDDTLGAGWIDFERTHLPVRAMKGAYADGAVAIVSPEQDEAILAHIPRTVQRVGWSEVRRELSGRAQARLEAAWPAAADRERAA